MRASISLLGGHANQYSGSFFIVAKIFRPKIVNQGRWKEVWALFLCTTNELCESEAATEWYHIGESHSKQENLPRPPRFALLRRFSVCLNDSSKSASVANLRSRVMKNADFYQIRRGSCQWPLECCRSPDSGSRHNDRRKSLLRRILLLLH